MGFKVCTKCKESKSIESFYKQTKASDGLNTWCKTCITLGMKLHARKRKQDAILLLGNRCVICNKQYHQSAYDFHHIDKSKKEMGVAKLLQSYAVTHQRVQKELSKCILVCSNCHRELHSKEEDTLE